MTPFVWLFFKGKAEIQNAYLATRLHKSNPDFQGQSRTSQR